MIWMTAYDGHLFDLDAFDVADVAWPHIAVGLSRLPRFLGQTRPEWPAYSVAQHCVWCSQVEGYADVAVPLLLHDAAEAYIGDVASPLKRWLYVDGCRGSWLARVPLVEFEEKLLQKIFEAGGVPWPSEEDWERIRACDRLALRAEWATLRVGDAPCFAADDDPPPLDEMPWPADEAAARWLIRLRELGVEVSRG